MIRRILKWFGLYIVYIDDEWGEYNYGFDDRPVHIDMRVAPPWARLRIRRRPADTSRFQ
jgi:hypothetical protein